MAGELAVDHDGARVSLFAFRFILGCGSVVFAVVSAQWLTLSGTLPWTDMANTAVLLGALVGVSCKPHWRPVLSWIAFSAFVANALEGPYPADPQPISSTHLVWPLLVLCAALLGDPWLSAAGMAFVGGEYLATMARHRPLARPEFLGLTNLRILSLASLAVWWARRRLVRALRGKTGALETELDEKRRQQRVIVHDIVHPLGAARNRARPLDRVLAPGTVRPLAGGSQPARGPGRGPAPPARERSLSRGFLACCRANPTGLRDLGGLTRSGQSFTQTEFA
jgi:hypothetical protein